MAFYQNKRVSLSLVVGCHRRGDSSIGCGDGLEEKAKARMNSAHSIDKATENFNFTNEIGEPSCLFLEIECLDNENSNLSIMR